MKTVFKFLSPLAFIFFLSSCEDVIQIKLDEGEKLYVVDAFVNNLRTPQVVRVLTSSAYFSNAEAPGVSDAVVILKDLTSNTQYPFLHSSQGNYVFNLSATDTIARQNHQYELNVTIDGVLYTALTLQKRGASIDSISAELPDDDFGPPSSNPQYFCTMWAKDKVDNNPDYYWVKTMRNDTLFTSGNDINVCIDGTGGVVTGLDVDSVYFTPPSTFLGFNSFMPGSTCKVQIHSLDRGTYYFLTQALAQINNGGLFATTPENVKTNLVTPKNAKTKCVGWFNMATVATGSVQIPN